jgi:hypothetical protein
MFMYTTVDWSWLKYTEYSLLPQHPRADAEKEPYMIIWDSLSDDLPLGNTISLLFGFQPKRLERDGPCRQLNFGSFVGLVVPVQEIFVLPWLL